MDADPFPFVSNSVSHLAVLVLQLHHLHGGGGGSNIIIESETEQWQRQSGGNTPDDERCDTGVASEAFPLF
ncbi:hypothetical protein JOB18_008306 [Solea senegalensis]|uniref:Uncharacterized protein n=1 Tax=Solea senegalensis TaxID=28829 RepID=A0AAV6QGG9_SOLSE|nr:hypothetical protein JOB18_008306 [Solea senegalensis]